MDILTHALCGAAAGTVVAGFAKADSAKTDSAKADSDKGVKTRLAVIAAAAAGAVLPDLDAISLWSKFDGTFGKIFALEHSGRYIYSAKFWYSHHAFMHSVFAGILTAASAGAACFFIKKAARPPAFENIKKFFISKKLYFAGFLSGWLLHLLGDLPTPAAAWGGIRMWFPLKAYVGGSGKIWWWNNYDIFLTACAVIVINAALLSLEKYLKGRIKILTFAVFMSGFLFAFYQIETRGFDFGYSGSTEKFQEYEQKSKDVQKDILGGTLYKIMEKLDKRLPFNF
ncbi:MAG: metal-dependent hydrolase [Endomicrobia bacterium]|nr:metal-dependent hydrolase [Endomicrobiia bacterium]